MSDEHGQWVVCLRDISAGEDTLIGPYRTVAKATSIAQLLRANIRSRNADSIYDAIVERLRPVRDVPDIRDEILSRLDSRE